MGGEVFSILQKRYELINLLTLQVILCILLKTFSESAFRVFVYNANQKPPTHNCRCR
jgi:hypothetical protein